MARRTVFPRRWRGTWRTFSTACLLEKPRADLGRVQPVRRQQCDQYECAGGMRKRERQQGTLAQVKRAPAQPTEKRGEHQTGVRRVHQGEAERAEILRKHRVPGNEFPATGAYDTDQILLDKRPTEIAPHMRRTDRPDRAVARKMRGNAD